MRAPAPHVAAALLLAVAAAPAAEPSATPQEIPHRLVAVETIDPPPLPEIRYATRYNFTGEVLYPAPDAYVHADVAAALAAVQKDLAARGLGLKIYDGYRPLSVQQKMWDLVRDERYVSNPARNRGRHTRGTAVDVTLVDHLGRELPMPTDFDDFTPKAHRDDESGTDEQKANRRTLEDAMVRHGFIPYPYEWWHFDWKGWEDYPVLDIRFIDLRAGRSTTYPID